MLEFISFFDTRTTILLVSVAFFIQANAICAQALLIKTYKGVRTALLGNLSIAFGFFFNLFQGILPDWVSIVLGNFLLLQGPNLFQVAFSRFLGQSHNKRLIYGLSITLLAVLIYFTFISFNFVGRVVGTSFCVGTSILVAVYKLYGERAKSLTNSVSG